jgi:hypothetical protein
MDSRRYFVAAFSIPLPLALRIALRFRNAARHNGFIITIMRRVPTLSHPLKAYMRALRQICLKFGQSPSAQ